MVCDMYCILKCGSNFIVAVMYKEHDQFLHPVFCMHETILSACFNLFCSLQRKTDMER